MFQDQPTVSPSSIWIDRENRQRKVIDVEDLVPSIRRRGVTTPLVVDEVPGPNGEPLMLVCGERRLTAAREVGLDSVPYTLKKDLTPFELKEIELEENVKRKALAWQDEALAVLEIHELYAANNEDWTTEKTAAVVCLSTNHTRRLLDVARYLRTGDEAVYKCDGIGSAITLLTRRKEREKGEALNTVTSLIMGGSGLKAAIRATREPDDVVEEEEEAAPIEPTKPPFSIECVDAFKFLSDYDEEPFNFIHVDFPYGVVLNEQANQQAFEVGYESDAKIYWRLCNAFADSFERIAFPSCHVMFWFSFEFRDETLELFQKHPRTRRIEWQNIPLIWHKTDNRGILSDAFRRPRNIGEYALLGTCGDRHLAKAKANIYGAPTDKSSAIHTNEKPEPMLTHFFEMFIDQHSRVFDPTAGSGSAIRVAEKLGAESGLGLEFNPELAQRAQNKLEQDRGLRMLASRAREAGAV